jgi:hypothetical protein
MARQRRQDPFGRGPVDLAERLYNGKARFAQQSARGALTATSDYRFEQFAHCESGRNRRTLLLYFLTGIFVFPSDLTLSIGQMASLGKVLAQFWSTVPPAAPGGVGLASRGHATPRNAVYPIDSADTSPSPYVATKICCAPRAAYPAGTGSVTILRSMPPNSRRVR